MGSELTEFFIKLPDQFFDLCEGFGRLDNRRQNNVLMIGGAVVVVLAFLFWYFFV